MMATSVQANGHSPQNSFRGTTSVRDFFSAIPWTGQPLPTAWNQPSTGAVAPPETLGMNLSVRTFFSRFAWDGKPVVAAPLMPLEMQADVPSQEDDLTLDGFAGLF